MTDGGAVTGGILSGRSIHKAVECGDISIEPFDPKQLNPVSYDLRLGSGLAVYNEAVYTILEEQRPSEGRNLCPYTSRPVPIDPKIEQSVTRFTIGPNGFVLVPGVGYLAHTIEIVHTDKYVPIVDGKSSWARLFLQVHCTAGFGDPGYRGNYTLEVTVTHPIRVYAGARIAQIRFHEISGDVHLYAGNYQGETSTGAVPSRAWKQFGQ
jgi:dCTP deaminase